MTRKKEKNKYPLNWWQIATKLKEKHNWTCERCGEVHNPNTGYTLTVHHLDRDKANCTEWNLAVLCQRCHLSIQNRVDFEQMYMFDHTDWMRPHVEGRNLALKDTL